MSEPTRGGAAIRARREALGLGLRECARKVGLSATFLSRYECGQTTTGVPAGAALCRLAKVLGLDEYEVCTAAGQAHPEALAMIRRWSAAARSAVAVGRVLDDEARAGRLSWRSEAPGAAARSSGGAGDPHD